MKDMEEISFPGLLCSREDISHNMRLHVWADGSATLLACNRSVFRSPGWEAQGGRRRRSPLGDQAAIEEDEYREAEQAGRFLSDGVVPPEDAENIRRSVRRARAKVAALARSNTFSFFITLTLSPEKVSRYDDAAVLRKFCNWLGNAAKRHGLAYCIVPERHKDGAIHFHGFINDALRVVDSGTVIPAGGGRPRRPSDEAERSRMIAEGGHIVYNLPQWDFGFTTAIRLYGEYGHAVGYVLKYIGKDLSPATGLPEKIGGRWYYSGGPLVRPAPVLLDGDFEEICRLYDGYDFTVKATGDRFRQIEIPAFDGGIYGNEKGDKDDHAGNG